MGSQEFLAYLLEQLGTLPRLEARRMFGATGLYSAGVFFGIVSGDTLYLRVAPAQRAAALAAGRAAFRPYADRDLQSRWYFSVPAQVLEDAVALTEWSRRAIASRPADAARHAGKHRRHKASRRARRTGAS
ncbi:MAG: TfoX/Sxy family protein [Gammaproteobacteria bacterium]|nr:TfoX/Sxy family protein [Gammaproteobacteria bacterium]